MGKQMIFSKRFGFEPSIKEIQISSMDEELKNRLWNILYEFIISIENGNFDRSMDPTISFNMQVYMKILFQNFYKLPYDEILIDYNSSQRRNFIKEKYFSYEWYVIYDFIELNLSIIKDISDEIYNKNYYKNKVNEINAVLEEEFSGYRIIDDIICPITNKLEIEQINKTFEQLRYLKLKGPDKHIVTALSLLSDKTKPDYRNSIKESISAVESIVNIINVTNSDTLSNALKKINKNNIIHSALIAAFDKIYGYTSNAEGLRHFMLDSPNADYEDAYYMLISCSAFINYLILKCEKVGINLERKS